MKIVILVVALCLAVVLGGQMFYLINIDDTSAQTPVPAGVSGRIDCGPAGVGCCAEGLRVFLDYPDRGVTSAPGPAAASVQVACGEFFHFDQVEPGRHFLYGQYRPAAGVDLVTCELASVKVAAGEHQSLGTVVVRP